MEKPVKALLQKQEDNAQLPAAEALLLLEKYTELTDLSPAGIFTLDRNGIITEINLSGALLLGYEKSSLLQKDFHQYIASSSQPIFDDFFNGLFSHNVKAGCELVISNPFKHDQYVQASGISVNKGNNCLLTLTDISDKRKAAIELKRKERIFNASADMHCIISVDGYFQLINDSWAKTTGWLKEELLKKPVVDFIHIDDVDACAQLRESIVTKEDMMHHENRFLCKDGAYRHFEWSVSFDPEENNVIAIAVDITDRKEMEEALKLSNLRFNFVTKATFDTIWDWNIETGELFWGDNYNILFGHDSTDSSVNLKGWHNNIHPEDVDRVIDSLKQSIEDNHIDKWDEEYRFRRNNGEFASIQDQAVIIRNAKGNAIRIIGAMQDITSQKQTQQQMLDLEKRYRALIENSADGIIIVSAIGAPLYVSPSVKNILGYDEAEVMQMDLRSVSHPDDWPGKVKHFQAALDNPGVPSAGKAFRILHKNGTWRWIENTVTSMLHIPLINGVVENFRDVTERTKVAEELTRLNKDLSARAEELAVTNEELQAFAYMASHDLQEPLRMVSGFMQLLKKNYSQLLDEKAQQYIQFATEGADNMKLLIKDLLEYSKLGNDKDAFKQVDMNLLMEEIKTLFAGHDQIIDKPIIKYHSLPVILANHSHIMQLMQNLVGNAIKYKSNETPVIEVTGREEAKQFVFSVKDNGIGIDASYHKKIFVLFQRLGLKDVAGTGIGLAICKKIVEKHNGVIWVESDTGKGSTFHFTINKQPGSSLQ